MPSFASECIRQLVRPQVQPEHMLHFAKFICQKLLLSIVNVPEEHDLLVVHSGDNCWTHIDGSALSTASQDGDASPRPS